jgi:hypothetical protein
MGVGPGRVTGPDTRSILSSESSVESPSPGKVEVGSDVKCEDVWDPGPLANNRPGLPFIGCVSPERRGRGGGIARGFLAEGRTAEGGMPTLARGGPSLIGGAPNGVSVFLAPRDGPGL